MINSKTQFAAFREEKVRLQILTETSYWNPGSPGFRRFLSKSISIFCFTSFSSSSLSLFKFIVPSTFGLAPLEAADIDSEDEGALAFEDDIVEGIDDAPGLEVRLRDGTGIELFERGKSATLLGRGGRSDNLVASRELMGGFALTFSWGVEIELRCSRTRPITSLT
jgi:hypothetical protein